MEINPPDHNNNLPALEAMKQHELPAFDQFYDQYAGALYGDIKRTLYKEDVSEETLASIFAIISSSIHEFDPATEKIFSWAMRIAHREISKRKIELTLQEVFLTKP